MLISVLFLAAVRPVEDRRGWDGRSMMRWPRVDWWQLTT